RPRSDSRTAAAGAGTVLVAVRVTNRSSHAVLCEGPARFVLRCWVLDDNGRIVGGPGAATPLPRLLVPGRAMAAAIRVHVPALAGCYRVAFWAEPAVEQAALIGESARGSPEANTRPAAETWLTLVVESSQGSGDHSCCAPLLAAAQTALAEAD